MQALDGVVGPELASKWTIWTRNILLSRRQSNRAPEGLFVGGETKVTDGTYAIGSRYVIQSCRIALFVSRAVSAYGQR